MPQTIRGAVRRWYIGEMGYFAAPFPNLFSAGIVRNAYGDRRFNVVDGGSRGALFEPLDAVKDYWTSYAFDADVDAPNYSGHMKRMPYGLWSETKTVQLHLAVEPSTSSVYPPDLELFDTLYGKHLGTDVRTTAKMVDVPCISVDDAVARSLMPKPQFLKLDVHSSEYEAVHGARNSLDQCVCVLVETWTHPFHKGQKCHGHVEGLLNDLGFYMYDMAPMYIQRMKGDRRLLPCTESLFFPDRAPAGLELLHVALLDLFRYTHYAIQMCDVYGLPKEVKEALVSFPSQRAQSWMHPAFYKRWLKNVAKALVYPTREVTFNAR